MTLTDAPVSIWKFIILFSVFIEMKIFLGYLSFKLYTYSTLLSSSLWVNYILSFYSIRNSSSESSNTYFTSLDLELFSLHILEKWLLLPHLWQDFPVAGHLSRLNSWLKPQNLHFWRKRSCDTLSITIGSWYIWSSVNADMC